MESHENQSSLTCSALYSRKFSVQFLKGMESGKTDGWYLEEEETDDQEDSRRNFISVVLKQMIVKKTDKTGTGTKVFFLSRMPSGKLLSRLLCAPNKCNSASPLKLSVMLNNIPKPSLGKQNLLIIAIHASFSFIFSLQFIKTYWFYRKSSHFSLFSPYCCFLVLTFILSQLDKAVLIGLSVSNLTPILHLHCLHKYFWLFFFFPPVG